ncbi:hypothetical protein ACFX1S_040246 [Malus domestica]
MAQVLQLSILYVAAVAFMFQQCCDGKLMNEYIGATGIPITFDSVPIDSEIDFHFILGFAIDADPSCMQQNGIFSPYWQSTLTPQSVSAIKQKHSNVKVMVSLSGWSLGESPSLVQSNKPEKMGELITGLKNKGLISVASIAPFYSTTAPYVQLFDGYADVIDYVNHQFYTDKVTTAKGYLQAFKLRAAQFGKEKLLPAYEVDGRGIQGDAFFDALTLLQTNGFEINGVMIFSADASSKNNFYYERKFKAFLLNSTSSAN